MLTFPKGFSLCVVMPDAWRVGSGQDGKKLGVEQGISGRGEYTAGSAVQQKVRAECLLQSPNPNRQFSPCIEGVAAPYISELPFCLSGNLMSSKAMPLYAFDIREA